MKPIGAGLGVEGADNVGTPTGPFAGCDPGTLVCEGGEETVVGMSVVAGPLRMM